MRKIGAIILAILMLAVAGLAFADGETTLNEKGIVGDDSGTALNKSLIIYKELTGFNPTGSDVHAPNITWNYSIAPIEANDPGAGKTITDKDEVVAVVKAGIGEPSITPSVAWTSAETIKTAAGGNHSNQKPIIIGFSDINFTAAGVYRYLVTEALAPGFAYNTSGVTDGTITNTRYLDVYVRDARDGETGCQIYGYVLFQTVPEAHTANDTSDSDVTAAVKTTGFVADTGADGTNKVTADSYYTYNVTISKTLVGDSAMNSNKFPFTVTFANGTIMKNIDITGTADGTATAGDPANGPINVTVNPGIAHGGTAVYTGIPVGTTVTVYETNNVTGTTYKSSVAITTAETSDTVPADKIIAPQIVSNSAAVASTAPNTAAAGDKTIAFTNTLELISPTGVIVRIAPYVLMMAAGIALLAIFLVKRRKHHEEE